MERFHSPKVSLSVVGPGSNLNHVHDKADNLPGKLSLSLSLSVKEKMYIYGREPIPSPTDNQALHKQLLIIMSAVAEDKGRGGCLVHVCSQHS